ncbi:MAG: hypothetical protein ACLP5H_32215 [Desulfomonilaceae bacterium]
MKSKQEQEEELSRQKLEKERYALDQTRSTIYKKLLLLGLSVFAVGVVLAGFFWLLELTLTSPYSAQWLDEIKLTSRYSEQSLEEIMFWGKCVTWSLVAAVIGLGLAVGGLLQRRTASHALKEIDSQEK